MRPPLLRRLGRLLVSALLAATACTFALPSPASAAGGLTQVTGFGSNPGNLAMYTYVPDGLPRSAPVVVAMHGCAQSANDYYANSGWTTMADRYKFAVVFPQTSAANNSLSCFTWFDPADTGRGKGEVASVVSMVDKAAQLYGSDRARVYVTGLSAGGGMTANLLAAYPDVFAGGAVDSGLPAQCATSQTGASGCQYGSLNLTPAQWGDKVRAQNPGYAGPWPRVAIWQGTSDYTVYPVNATELRDQWTNVWGLSQTPSSTTTLPGSTTLTSYDDAGGEPAVQLYQISGMGHGLAVDPGTGEEQCGKSAAYFLDTICSSYYTAHFWGLDGAGTGPGDGDALPAPAGLKAGTPTATSVPLSWSAVAGAASYHVYRGGTRVGTPSGTSFTDSALTAGTSYTWTVAAVDNTGKEGARSAPVTASTTGGGTPATCVTANNYAHVAAGRAHVSGGYTYTNGGNQNMGLYNVFITHTLRQTGPDSWELADGAC
ncbi:MULTISPECIES: PHB depolymerase family esterase [Streptomyces]|uniref:PHB depolymerase family esterase n=1 Tax=Streptomyces evansiae TaxID=3075535 RepID=A0ABU2R3V5_9ACTN|nr:MULTISPECIES: PHB depolymerase family esterase [unclassified Streptomyces]MDT0411387.1 PHB depolymerase family esterase [Streptomyces sp. DSM 41979]MYQ59661.1 PHB depolymerase family esterase [Streptomyces sp. SID4926]SCE17852.1 esterase, PHB depolymerase family [Streptomyces sp. DfronAA-171]